jgi:hypothetical protein
MSEVDFQKKFREAYSGVVITYEQLKALKLKPSSIKDMKNIFYVCLPKGSALRGDLLVAQTPRGARKLYELYDSPFKLTKAMADAQGLEIRRLFIEEQ